MRKKVWPILLIGLFICGSILILPRFLYFIIINEIAHGAHISLPAFDRGEYTLGRVLLYNARIALYEDVQLICDGLAISFSPLDIALSPYDIKIYGDDCTVRSANEENNILGFTELALHKIRAHVSIERGKHISFDEGTVHGDFGRCLLTGTINNNNDIALDISLFLHPEFLQQLPLPMDEEIDSIQHEYTVSISVRGTLPFPDIEISSQHFNLTLKSNE